MVPSPCVYPWWGDVRAGHTAVLPQHPWTFRNQRLWRYRGTMMVLGLGWLSPGEGGHGIGRWGGGVVRELPHPVTLPRAGELRDHRSLVFESALIVQV